MYSFVCVCACAHVKACNVRTGVVDVYAHCQYCSCLLNDLVNKQILVIAYLNLCQNVWTHFLIYSQLFPHYCLQVY